MAVKCGVEAVALDRAAKTVTAKNLSDGSESVYSYDKLVLAVGASPVAPPIEGVNLKNVFFLRTPEDAVPCARPPRAARSAGPWWWAAATSAWRLRRTWPPGYPHHRAGDGPPDPPRL